ncbi:MAG: response regulator transcription factor [Proteobacteria bacterium]|nr:response regulator transcription factor [Pseudomonadota bacterium]
MTISILLADDHQLFREGVRQLLVQRGNYEVVGEAGDGETAVELALRERPDVVLMDVAMPRLSGILATRRIVEEHKDARILILSALAESLPVEESLRAGAAGYMVKSGSTRDLVSALEAVQAGGSYLSPGLSSQVVRNATLPSRASRGMAELSDREREVLAGIAEGFSSREIARRLCLSPRTVDSHRVRLMRKLGIHKSQSLVRFAIRAGLVQP